MRSFADSSRWGDMALAWSRPLPWSCPRWSSFAAREAFGDDEDVVLVLSGSALKAGALLSDIVNRDLPR